MSIYGNYDFDPSFFYFFYKTTKIRTYHSDFEGRTIYFLKYLEKLYTKSLTFCFMSNKKEKKILFLEIG